MHHDVANKLIDNEASIDEEKPCRRETGQNVAAIVTATHHELPFNPDYSMRAVQSQQGPSIGTLRVRCQEKSGEVLLHMGERESKSQNP